MVFCKRDWIAYNNCVGELGLKYYLFCGNAPHASFIMPEVLEKANVKRTDIHHNVLNMRFTFSKKIVLTEWIDWIGVAELLEISKH